MSPFQIEMVGFCVLKLDTVMLQTMKLTNTVMKEEGKHHWIKEKQCGGRVFKYWQKALPDTAVPRSHWRNTAALLRHKKLWKVLQCVEM
jgi:hypothetical protein